MFHDKWIASTQDIAMCYTSGDVNQLRRLNEWDICYENSIVKLAEKFKKSNFNETITNETISKITKWKNGK